MSASPSPADLGQDVTLTVTVDSPCEATTEHRVGISSRPADDSPDCPQTPRPVTTVTVPAAKSATATATVRPPGSTDYLFGLEGMAYSQLPYVTVRTTSPAPSPPPPVIEVTPTRVVSGQPVAVTVQGALCTIDLYAQTARAAAPRIVRTDVPGSGTGTVRFELRPTDHTVVWAQSRDRRTANSGRTVQVPITVDRAVSIGAQRLGTRSYVFSGAAAPAQAGLLVNLYRVDPGGRRVLTAQTRTASTGGYRVVRTFTGSGRFDFFTTVSADSVAGPGRSRARPTVVH